jgi:hypothetical protein
MKFSLLSVAAGVIGSALAIPLSTRASNTIASGKNYDRIVTIVFENTDYSAAASDPYLSSLAQKHNGNDTSSENYYFASPTVETLMSFNQPRYCR